LNKRIHWKIFDRNEIRIWWKKGWIFVIITREMEYLYIKVIFLYLVVIILNQMTQYFLFFTFICLKWKKIYNHFWQSARISKRSLGYIFSFNVYFHAIFSLRHLNVVMWKSFFDGFFFANPFCRSKTRVVEKNNCQSLLTKLSHSNLDHNC